MGSGRGALAIFAAILLVVVLCFPSQTLFLLKFVWDIILQNLQPLLQSFLSFFKHILPN